MSADRAVCPIRVDLLVDFLNVLTRSAESITKKKKSFLPPSDRLPFFSSYFSSRLTVRVQSICFAEWSFFRSPWELGSLFMCLCAWVRGRQTERQADDDVCVWESESDGVWIVAAALYWMEKHHLLCLYTKKIFCFEKNNWTFHRKPESRQPHHCLKGSSHTQRSIFMPESVSVTFVSYKGGIWDNAVCLFCYHFLLCCQMWSWGWRGTLNTMQSSYYYVCPGWPKFMTQVEIICWIWFIYSVINAVKMVSTAPYWGMTIINLLGLYNAFKNRWLNNCFARCWDSWCSKIQIPACVPFWNKKIWARQTYTHFQQCRMQPRHLYFQVK